MIKLYKKLMKKLLHIYLRKHVTVFSACQFVSNEELASALFDPEMRAKAEMETRLLNNISKCIEYKTEYDAERKDIKLTAKINIFK